LLGYIIGLVTMVDFYHAGIMTVLVFYFFRQRKWWSYLGQTICLWYINTEMLGGFSYELHMFRQTYFLLRQSFALLALIPIWLYRGNQGYHSKQLQMVYYVFYPLHLLILGVIKLL
ncbi:MAG: conjugal transfer protein TraX, partial [Lachnospiraceae bacterium]|nr:conjugal transfer protein TraX [Lachnospiraceae bacterium]